MAALTDRLAFLLHKLPLLLKGTSDDDSPCPGYLYEEIAKISHESPGSCQCLLEYLLNRLQSSSCYVKLKVLKILLSLWAHGASQFVQDLRRNASFIQQAAAVSGPPDPFHGNSLYQKVRCAAQELVGSLFSDAYAPPLPVVQPSARTQTGMGSQTSLPQALRGFGYSQERNGLEQASLGQGLTCVPCVCMYVCMMSQYNDTVSPVPLSPHRTESSPRTDCLQEAQLVWAITRGHRVFLTREEVQQFVRGCSLLNCEVVFEMLNRSLEEESGCVRMRSMCAISSLMTSDLLSHDHMMAVVRENLQKLSQETPGPVTDKATKILCQFEAHTRNIPVRRALHHVTGHCRLPPPPRDLLSDVAPQHAGGGLLTPVSLPSSPTTGSDTPNPAGADSAVSGGCEGSWNWNAESAAAEEGSPGQNSGGTETPGRGRGDGHCPVLLFDGMELVQPVRSRDRGDRATARPPAATGNSDAAPEEERPKPGLPSAFSFLNS
ncbi:AP-4 complex accessory subunit tepsin [Ascaphus truei]|uniref:AP-4 complex accessory subunit tepsin n=1 Tax=Ascaphus truei TaxID=8439 RepID=UPI003F5ABCDF